VSGWYCSSCAGGRYEGGLYRVDSEGGISFDFGQTRDPRNNGTGPQSGQMPVFYFKPASAVNKARTAVKDTPEGSDAPVEVALDIDLIKLTSGLTNVGVTSLLSIADWSLNALERVGVRGAPQPSGELVAAAKFALGVVLRTVAANLATPRTLATAVDDSLVPSEALVNAAVKVKGSLEESDDPSKEAAEKALADAGNTSHDPKAKPVSWLPDDAPAQATLMWEVDRCLRRIISLDRMDASIHADARRAYVAAFGVLYPTWKLKQYRLQQLLTSLQSLGRNAATAGTTAAAATALRNATARQMDAVLEAYTKEKTLAGLLYGAEEDPLEAMVAAAHEAALAAAAAAEAAEGEDGGDMEEGGEGEGEGDGGGVVESKDDDGMGGAGDGLPTDADLEGMSAEDREMALAMRLSMAEAGPAPSAPAAAAAAAPKPAPTTAAAPAPKPAPAPAPTPAAATAGGKPSGSGKGGKSSATFASTVEPLLQELYAPGDAGGLPAGRRRRQDGGHPAAAGAVVGVHADAPQCRCHASRHRRRRREGRRRGGQGRW